MPVVPSSANSTAHTVSSQPANDQSTATVSHPHQDPPAVQSTIPAGAGTPLTHIDPATGERIVNLPALLHHKQATEDKYKHTHANIERNRARTAELDTKSREGEQ